MCILYWNVSIKQQDDRYKNGSTDRNHHSNKNHSSTSFTTFPHLHLVEIIKEINTKGQLTMTKEARQISLHENEMNIWLFNCIPGIIDQPQVISHFNGRITSSILLIIGVQFIPMQNFYWPQKRCSNLFSHISTNPRFIINHIF